MKTRALIPLLVGLAIGAFAIRSFLRVLNKAQGSSPVATVEVVRAGVDIAPAVEITKAMVETASAPPSLVPGGAFNEPEKVIGRVASGMIPAGVPILASLLAPEGTLPGMASRIREGYRAVAVQIDEIAGVAGWLKPGSRVDVVLVMTSQGSGRSQSISKVVLQNVEVLAVGQEIESEGTKASVTRSVTVLVKPEEATKLALASAKGKLRLAMRNQADNAEPRSPAMTDKDLLEDTASRESAQDRDAGPSLLDRLFGKVAKIEPKQTDKQEPGPLAFGTAAPVPMAAAPPAREWVVDVLSGPESYELRFDSNRRDARQTSGDPGGPNRSSGPPTRFGTTGSARQGDGAGSHETIPRIRAVPASPDKQDGAGDAPPQTE